MEKIATYYTFDSSWQSNVEKFIFNQRQRWQWSTVLAFSRAIPVRFDSHRMKRRRGIDSGWISCCSLMRSRFELIHIRRKDDGGDSGRLSWCGLMLSRFDFILIRWKDDGSDSGRLSWRALVHSRLLEKRRRARLQGSTVLAWSRAILVWLDSHSMERWHWGNSGPMSWRGLLREISVQDHSRSPYHKSAMTWTPSRFE